MSQPTRAPTVIDFKVPTAGVVSLALGLIGQTAALLIWGARLDDHVNANTADIASIQVKLTANAKLAETVARVDERTQALAVTINRIDERTDQGRGR